MDFFISSPLHFESFSRRVTIWLEMQVDVVSTWLQGFWGNVSTIRSKQAMESISAIVHFQKIFGTIWWIFQLKIIKWYFYLFSLRYFYSPVKVLLDTIIIWVAWARNCPLFTWFVKLTFWKKNIWMAIVFCKVYSFKWLQQDSNPSLLRLSKAITKVWPSN